MNLQLSPKMQIIYSSKPDSVKDYLKKIYEHRSLILTFAKRDLKIKFAQTTLGITWAILQPLTAVFIFTVFFSLIVHFQTSYPYVLFVMSGVLIWCVFNYVFSQASSSLYQSQDLIKKMSFPKIILPLSKVLLALVEFIITFILILILMLFFQIEFRWTMFLLPIIILPVLFFSFGIALMLSSFALKNRDLFHVIPFLINFGIWFTPVFYPISILPSEYKNLIYINPIAVSIQLFRWCFLGDAFNLNSVIGGIISIIVLIIGFYFFKKSEDKIIDLL